MKGGSDLLGFRNLDVANRLFAKQADLLLGEVGSRRSCQIFLYPERVLGKSRGSP